MYLFGQRGSADEGLQITSVPVLNGPRQARSHTHGKPVVPSHPLYPPLAANSGRFRRGEVFLRAVVKRTVVGSAGAPAAPDNPQQGSCKNPDCLLVIHLTPRFAAEAEHRVARQERHTDRTGDVGENFLGARPVRVE